MSIDPTFSAFLCGAGLIISIDHWCDGKNGRAVWMFTLTLLNGYFAWLR